MNKKFLPVLFTLFISVPAWALPPALETKVQAAIQELKKANPGDQDACGEIVLVESETSTEDAKGITGGHFPTQVREAWGCHSAPGGAIRNGHKFSHDVIQENGQTRQVIVSVTRELYFDKNKSALMEGRITGRDGKGKRHAKVRLVNARSGASFETDADSEGNYEISIPSGEYAATASADGCSQTKNKQLCAFGQAGGTPVKHGPFRQDFKLSCDELIADITGRTQMDFHMQEEGVTVDGHGSFTIKGQVPLHLDAQTGAVTGEGTMVHLYNGDLVDKSVFCDEEGCHEINGVILPSFPNHEYHVTAKGQAQSGMAEIVFEHSTAGAPVHGQINGPAGPMGFSAPSEPASYTVKIKLPYTEGASASYDEAVPIESYGTTEIHSVYTLKKKEDAGPPPTLPPSSNGGSGQGGSGGHGPSDSGGNSGGGPGGRLPIVAGGGKMTLLNIPTDPDEDDQTREEQTRVMSQLLSASSPENIADILEEDPDE